jgi:hypothetical protein
MFGEAAFDEAIEGANLQKDLIAGRRPPFFEKRRVGMRTGGALSLPSIFVHLSFLKDSSSKSFQTLRLLGHLAAAIFGNRSSPPRKLEAYAGRAVLT